MSAHENLAEFKSQDSCVSVIKQVANLLNREVERSEMEFIVGQIDKADINFMRRHPNVKRAQKAMAYGIMDAIKAHESEYIAPLSVGNDEDESIESVEDTDVRAVMNEYVHSAEAEEENPHRPAIVRREQEMAPVAPPITVSSHITNMLGVGDIAQLASIMNPSSLLRSFPVMSLDTRNRALNDSNPGSRSTISWNYNSSGFFSTESVNTSYEIRNIVSIECANIYLPIIDDNMYQEFRQISMLIKELSGQSSQLTASRQFHFLFDADTITNDSGSERLKLTSAFNRQIVEFTPPMTTISAFTLEFGSPAELLSFGYDRDSNPTSVSTSDPAVFTTSMDHGMQNGDLVYIEGFTTDTPSSDGVIINMANREAGHVIQSVTDNTFEIAALDTSALTNPRCTAIIFGNQRFFVPLKLTYTSGQIARFGI